MTSERARQREAEVAARREALTREACDMLAESLHERFCDSDEAVGPWDRAVCEHIVYAFLDLPVEQYGALIASYALNQRRDEPPPRH